MDLNSFLSFIFVLLNIHQILAAQNPDHTLETYIVHVEPQQSNTESWFNSFLPDSISEPRILYHYRNVFSGFAAKLSVDDLKTIQNKPGFISARPERLYPLHTTHSPNFLGLNRNSGLWNVSNYGKGVVIGLIDTGITPNHPSFGDEGMPPPPAKWKGKCEFDSSVCNKKVIGARNYCKSCFDNKTPSDEVGHGTHTAATAAGNFLQNANIFGNANGTASGVAPHAHLAIYKVCGGTGCWENGIIAALDTAIDDGVDILSLSLGAGGSFPFFNENIALGAYRAMEKGIFISSSAGNTGPVNETLSNEAPWILTVGASTIDRKIRVVAVLGNNEELEGESAFLPKDFPSEKQLPLVVSTNDSNRGFSNCNDFEFDDIDVRGKIVVCRAGGSSRFEKGEAVKKAGASAMILVNSKDQGYTTLADPDVLPATDISYADGLKIIAYLNSTSIPTATILYKGTIIGDNHAPSVAAFSSRGPSVASPGILKPDIIGPGVNILAAWRESVENKTNTKSNFYMISGTSMSCPHLSGVAALLKSIHPDWSTAAIKSAIMTTADQVNLGGNPIEDQSLLPADIFSIGAGHVNPLRANDPGLVYDIQPDDYIPYLCGLNYTNQQVSIIVQRRVDCSKESSILETELNYPSFSVKFGSTPQTYTRTVTNVGESNASYEVEIVSPVGVTVKVEPAKLNFSQIGQKLRYTVTFTGSAMRIKSTSSQGFIKWNSGKHSVRSPIAVVFE